MNEHRKAFEAWISASPYERDITRNPKDETVSAWPGQYVDNTVQVAWEAWLEAKLLMRGEVENAYFEGAEDHKETGTDNIKRLWSVSDARKVVEGMP